MGNWDVIDTTGKMVIEPQFDDVGSFEGGIAPVTRDKWNGLIDRTGRFIWGPTTESVGPRACWRVSGIRDSHRIRSAICADENNNIT